jgi:hypothetical protein
MNQIDRTEQTKTGRLTCPLHDSQVRNIAATKALTRNKFRVAHRSGRDNNVLRRITMPSATPNNQTK